ncbi:MAG: hypothetical protein EP343_04900 [Deltaproteobacteria bacterium]|nr:MAG: hypothetical protein EP343_04900 [Deltaproteobacteria bacterium]
MNQKQPGSGWIAWWSVVSVFGFLLGYGLWIHPGAASTQTSSAKRASSSTSSSPSVSETKGSTKASAAKSAALVSDAWIKGMTLSCFGWGAAWATPKMYNAMAELKTVGSNWVSYHPYSWIRWNGTLGFSRSTSQPTVLNPMRYAKSLGMKILLKPHIGYWGSGFSWRGAIKFNSERGWKRFFAAYEDWIVTQAKMAQAGGADMFSVGVEYIKTLHRVKDWRRIIAAVRKVYKGKLIYSANWDSFQKVKFWDALDVIGIQAYFPLTKANNPSEADLRKGWAKWLNMVCQFSKKWKRPVIFTELGYNYASHTAARPWDHSEGGPNAGDIKLRCMKVALEEVPKAPCIQGVFLWKWFPSSARISSNYTLQYPAMKRVLSACWKTKPPTSRKKQTSQPPTR